MAGFEWGEPRADAQLVAAARAGDKAAFAELVRRHRHVAATLAARMLGDDDLARDVVQEATVVALVSLGRLRSPDRFGAWLCGIALNVARRWLHELRSPPPRLPLSRPVRGADEQAEAAELASLVRAVVTDLAPGQREAVLAFYWGGLTHQEVAAELGLSVGAVKARLHQARAALGPKLALVIERKETATVSDTIEPQWAEVKVSEVRRAEGDDPTRRPHVVVLDEVAGSRRLPIWTGPAEGTALAVNLETVEMPRPMTYQMAANLVAGAGSSIAEVRITRLEEGTYYAVVVLGGPGGPVEVDARPSDALNLALVVGAPIRVRAEMLDDPDAVGRTDWQRYTTRSADLVAEVRQRQEEVMAAFTRERGRPPT